MATTKKTAKKPVPIKPVGKNARNIKNRATAPGRKPAPAPKVTDLLFTKLLEAGEQALTEQKFDIAEETLLHARFVGFALGKPRDSEEMVRARRAYLKAFAALLE